MNKLLVLLGPTATGKTELSLQLAREFNGEIVNADSRQVYRYMNVGTAKPTAQELARAPHHLIDIVDPDADFGLAQYQEQAYQAIGDIQGRGKLPVLVGGTGQYVWAVLEGWVIPSVAPDLEFRKNLQARVDRGEAGLLFKELEQADPSAAKRIDPRNVRRVIRALEVLQHAGEPFSGLQKKDPPDYDTLIIGLTAGRPELYRRIDARVDKMIEQGLVDEVQGLIKKGYSLDLPAMSGIGYRQIGQYLNGQVSLEEAVARIKFATHRVARHQYAWFRLDDESIFWLDIEKNFAKQAKNLALDFINGLK
jgi:tRNA dimethylallyltransferase